MKTLKIPHRFYSPDDIGGITPVHPADLGGVISEPIEKTVEIPTVVADKTQEQVAPLIDPVHDKLDKILEETGITREKVAAIEARLDERVNQVPEPVATPTVADVKEAVRDVVENSETVADSVPDAVELQVEHTKPEKKEEKKRKKRGLRR